MTEISVDNVLNQILGDLPGPHLSEKGLTAIALKVRSGEISREKVESVLGKDNTNEGLFQTLLYLIAKRDGKIMDKDPHSSFPLRVSDFADIISNPHKNYGSVNSEVLGIVNSPVHDLMDLKPNREFFQRVGGEEHEAKIYLPRSMASFFNNHTFKRLDVAIKMGLGDKSVPIILNLPRFKWCTYAGDFFLKWVDPVKVKQVDHELIVSRQIRKCDIDTPRFFGYIDFRGNGYVISEWLEGLCPESRLRLGGRRLLVLLMFPVCRHSPTEPTLLSAR